VCTALNYSTYDCDESNLDFAPPAGEVPCDGLDACCKTHDDCVERSGMLANKCHSAFVQCMHKEKKRNHNGFSQKVNLALASSTATLSVAIAAGYYEATQFSAHFKACFAVPVLHGDPCNGVRHAVCHDVRATGTRAVDGLALVNHQTALRANEVDKLTASLACTGVSACASRDHGPHLQSVSYKLVPFLCNCTTNHCAQSVHSCSMQGDRNRLNSCCVAGGI